MLNIRKWIFVTTFILLSFAVVGCVSIGVNLPEKDAIAIQKILDEGEKEKKEFTSFVVWDSNTRETVKFNRTEKDKEGKPLYTTRRISGPIPVGQIGGLTSYSVVGCVVNAKDESCNLIKIDGYDELLVCKNTGEVESFSSEEIASVKDEMKTIKDEFGKPEIRQMPRPLVENLKNHAGNSIKELGFAFAVIDNLDNQRVVLLLSTDHRVEPAEPLLQNISKIKENIVASTLVTYKKNPCCVTEVRNGAAVETCRRFCL